MLFSCCADLLAAPCTALTRMQAAAGTALIFNACSGRSCCTALPPHPPLRQAEAAAAAATAHTVPLHDATHLQKLLLPLYCKQLPQHPPLPPSTAPEHAPTFPAWCSTDLSRIVQHRPLRLGGTSRPARLLTAILHWNCPSSQVCISAASPCHGPRLYASKQRKGVRGRTCVRVGGVPPGVSHPGGVHPGVSHPGVRVPDP